MGIDVNLYVEADVSPERLNAAEEVLRARSTIPDARNGRALVVEDDDWLPRPRVSLYTLSRYYGPGYERGDWPSIYGAIRLMQALFPEAKVYYGGDSSDDGCECTDEYLAEVWEHFLGPNGDDYRARAHARNEAAAASREATR